MLVRWIVQVRWVDWSKGLDWSEGQQSHMDKLDKAFEGAYRSVESNDLEVLDQSDGSNESRGDG